jgi:hypothetical protein
MAKSKAAVRYSYPTVNEGDALDSFQCVTFLVPVGWWNKGALVSAYYFMGHVWSWTDSDYGKYIAAQWRLAFWESWKGNFMLSSTNIVNVTCAPSAAANCNNVTEINLVINAGAEVPAISDDTLPVLTDPALIPQYMIDAGSTTISLYDEARCRRANYIADRVETSVDVFNSLLGSLSGDFSEYLTERIVAGVGVAMMDTPAPGFADAAGVAIIVAPKMVSWALGAAFSADLLEIGITINKQAIVDKIYISHDAESFGNLHIEFLESAINSESFSDELKTIYKDYFRFVWGSRFGSWFYSSAEKLFSDIIPSNYPITLMCETVAYSGSIRWNFNSGDLQGWSYDSLSANTLIIDPTGILPNLINPTGGFVGAYPVVNPGVGKKFILYRDDLNLTVTADFGVGVRVSYSPWDVKMNIIFSDGTDTNHVKRKADLNGGDLISWDLSSHVGKLIVGIRTECGSVGDGTSSVMGYDSIIFGNASGSANAGTVELFS